MLIRFLAYLVAANTPLAQDLPGDLRLSYADQVRANGRSRTLSLREAAKTALQQNLDLQLEATNILLATQSIRSARDSYDPSLSVLPTWNSRHGTALEARLQAYCKRAQMFEPC
jgi:outer membrane protein TolC